MRDSDHPFREPPSRGLTLGLSLACAAGVFGLAGAVVGEVHLLLDLAGQLVLHWVVWLMGVTALSWWLSRSRIATASVLIAALHLGRLLPESSSAPHAGAFGARVRIVLANVLYSSRDQRSLVRLIELRKPDLVALTELSFTSAHGLRAVLSKYPYRIASLRADAFGIGLFSLRPLESSGLVDLRGIPAIAATIRIADRSVGLRVVHAMPPVSARGFRMRNAQLGQLAQAVGHERGPMIVLGDLNASPWSSTFRRFSASTGLTDTRRGRGLQTTWPASLPALLRIPLDHVLVSDGVVTLDRCVGPVTRSDHLPVYVELAIVRGGTTAAHGL
jgi:endonuclease/exonuclease/phosphatase (EEP) superfamily protein YafD